MVGQTDVTEVLRNMAAFYAAITSYSDSGEVSTPFTKTGNRMRIPFSTLYQKPSLFRFECSRPHPFPPLSHVVTRHVVGFDGISAYSGQEKYNQSETVTSIEKSLSLAIAGAGPCSHGSAHTIARLLIPGIEGLSILDLVNPSIKEENHIDGVVCYVIAAQYPHGAGCELWVEKDTPILRKAVQTDSMTCNEEFRGNVRVNEPVESGLFAA